MKKSIAVMMMVMVMLVSLTASASAVEPRTQTITPRLEIEGTTALKREHSLKLKW